MTRQRVLSATALCALMLLAGPVLANYLAGETVIISEPISEDFYLAGNHVDLRAPVQGDLAVAGRRVLINAPIALDLLAAAESIEVAAPIGDTVRVVGRTVRLHSAVGGHVVAAGEDILLARGADISDWAWLAGREVRVDGTVGRSLRVAAQNVVISGQIAGDAHIRADHLELLPGASIGGELQFYSAAQPLVADGADVSGGITTHTVEQLQLPAWSGALGRVFAGLTLLVTVVVIYLILPRFTSQAADRVLTAPVKSIAVGLGSLIGVPLLVVLLMATGLGALLGIVLLVGYLLWLLLGYAVACVFLATQALRRTGKAEVAPWYVSALAVAVAVGLLVLIPQLPFGGLVVLVLFLFAYGAVTLRAWETRH